MGAGMCNGVGRTVRKNNRFKNRLRNKGGGIVVNGGKMMGGT